MGMARAAIQMGEMHWLDKDGVPHDFFPRTSWLCPVQRAGRRNLCLPALRRHSIRFSLTARPASRRLSLFPVSAHSHGCESTVIESPNIIAELKGSDPALRDQYVVYTAHVDHLGICPAVEGDNVCHGALDNASGTDIAGDCPRICQPAASRRGGQCCSSS